MQQYYICIPSLVCDLWLCQKGSHLVRLTGTQPPDLSAYTNEKTPLLAEAEAQLLAYFKGDRKTFDLPLAPQGTPFQKAVWQALCSIPYGETRSYKDIAEAIGRPRAFRAVGQANNRNPLMILQPCHRVIGSDGSLTGFAYGNEKKLLLLELERRHL